jgi:hypothetical protein
MAESLAKDGAGEGAGDGTGEGWFKGMPPPKTTVPLIEGSEVMAWFDGMDVRPGPRTWLVVDVRGVEWKVCCFEFLFFFSPSFCFAFAPCLNSRGVVLVGWRI